MKLIETLTVIFIIFVLATLTTHVGINFAIKIQKDGEKRDLNNTRWAKNIEYNFLSENNSKNLLDLEAKN